MSPERARDTGRLVQQRGMGSWEAGRALHMGLAWGESPMFGRVPPSIAQPMRTTARNRVIKLRLEVPRITKQPPVLGEMEQTLARSQVFLVTTCRHHNPRIGGVQS